MNALLAAVIVVLGASASTRTRDLQVEAVAASGAELPELREAVARALLVGGARVVMRGPTTGACEYCAHIKVTEVAPGIFRVESEDQGDIGSTILDLSSGSRLLDRARAIAIHARLLVGRPASEGKGQDVAALPARKPVAKTASAQAKINPPLAAGPVARDPSPVRAEPVAAVAPTPAPGPLALPATPSEATRMQPGRSESKPPIRIVEAKRPNGEPRVAEQKEPAPKRQETEVASAPRVNLVAVPSHEAPRSLWPWLPTLVGAGAALSAGVCALVARQRYDGLSDRSQSLGSARSLKSSGETWQTAAYVLSGVAAAGLGVGIVGFATRSSEGHTVAASLSPIPSGGIATMAWGLP
jgi:hypothetical protein